LETVINFTDKVKPVINVNDGFSVCPNGDIKDLKYSAFDNYDLDITNNVKVNYSDNYIILTVSDSSNNKTIKNVKSIKDNISPVITINGDTNITISKGTEYIDKGASAIDNCDGDVAVVTSSNVDTNSVGSYKITYTATDKSGNSSSLERVVNVKEVNRGDRIIYLTFDDGPGKFTSKLLDVLNKYNVKATFFVTGKGEDSLIKREYEEGHSIGLHSYSHDYSYIYSSVDNYFNDLNRVSDRVYNITGYRTNLIRFPGGASNTISRHYDNGTHIMSTLTRLVLEKGYQYYDWNISSGDAGETTDTNTVYSNVINKLKEGSSVILQHDIKGFSVDAVEKIINYGLSNGYTFRGLDINSYNAHQRVNN
jgi:peptidoglycan/xylan/chitin deacetylase (PgdA/CDA1 family)